MDRNWAAFLLIFGDSPHLEKIRDTWFPGGRARYCGDPHFSRIPLDELLSDDYGRRRFELIEPERASPGFGPGDPKLEGEGDTTYLAVADGDGMTVSLIQSNYRGMGSGMVPDGLGFMFQDRGELFPCTRATPTPTRGQPRCARTAR